MGVKISDSGSPQAFKRKVSTLNNKKIVVGIFGRGLIARIAAVHEFGYVIKAKKKFLVVPLNKMAKENKPSNFKDLFFLRTDDGNNYLVRSRGDKLIFMYWLVRQVMIPERSFIRGSFDSNKKLIQRRVERSLKLLITGELTVDAFLTRNGTQLATMTQKYMTNLKDPKNSNITLEAKKPKSNPLINSGRMRQSVTFEIR